MPIPRSESEMEESGQQAYLANLRHELRTPLNAIIGYSELLLEEITGETGAVDQFRTDLGNIHVAGFELLALVNEALEPSMAELDATSLETILENLDFQLRTPINSVIGYVEMLLEDAPALGADELVSDMEHIHQAANRFLELMDGMVHEAFNNNSEDLSQAYAAAEEAISAVRPFVSEQPSERSEEVHGNLLVVDDNDINREVLARRMERQGHQVKVAVNGRQALELVAASRFDLILLDVIMPEMNGYQVLEFLKSEPDLRDIPVIMISALDELDSAVRCIEMGAEDYLTKPFNPVLLQARIGACLEKKRLRDKEVEYLRQAALVTAAAAAVESNEFRPESLDLVAARGDELGQLARVFQRMAREVSAREQRLKQQVQDLRIQVDEANKNRQVKDITDTDYFQHLQQKAKRLRESRRK